MQGFTLVELLVVVLIIGLLASMAIVVTNQAIYSARVANTRITIDKIDEIISEMYENFETRRLPTALPEHPFIAHAMRLWMLRDLMRMEMPSSWDEALIGPAGFQFQYRNENGVVTYAPPNYYLSIDPSPDFPPLRKMYCDAYYAAKARDPVIVHRYVSAKLLYLIVTLGNPETREAFHDSEIMTDEDGLSYFIDGWRSPISFMRWAPGLFDSDRQPVITNWSDNDQKAKAVENFPDPMNPVNLSGGIITILPGNQYVIDLDKQWPNGEPVIAWGLVPLIVSSGGAGREQDDCTLKWDGFMNTTVIIDPMLYENNEPTGSPQEKDGEINLNIITNHARR